MVFAVAMTFIDQTIVSIAVPDLQKDLGLSATGVQWVVNGYLLSLSALFAFGGRIADIAGHRSMVLLGIAHLHDRVGAVRRDPDRLAGRAVADRLPRASRAPGAAIMFPAALAIVVAAYPVDERGKALAIFFGVAGGLTAIGPMAGGVLVEWTWRAIFWVNMPVAVIATVLTLRVEARQHQAPGAARLPRRRADRPRHGPRRARAAAVEHLGLGRPGHLGHDRRRARSSSSSSSRSSWPRSTR